MKQLTRKLTTILVALLIVITTLTSCQTDTIALPGQPKTLRLVMHSDVSELSKIAIQYFSYKTTLLSKNELKIMIEEVENPIAELPNAHFMFLSNDEAKKVSSAFAPFESPFYFYDYAHLTISLNSAAFWEQNGDMIRSLIEVEPLGAFYTGSNAFLSAADNRLDTPDQYDDEKLYILEDELMEYTLEKMGADVYLRSQKELIDTFNSGKNRIIEIETLLLDQIKMPPKRDKIILCDSFHKAKVSWLFLSTESLSALTEGEIAIIREAAAYALAQNDKLVTSREEQAIASLETLNASVSKPNYNEFNSIVGNTLRNSAKYSNLWNWENYEIVKNNAIVK